MGVHIYGWGGATGPPRGWMVMVWGAPSLPLWWWAPSGADFASFCLYFQCFCLFFGGGGGLALAPPLWWWAPCGADFACLCLLFAWSSGLVGALPSLPLWSCGPCGVDFVCFCMIVLALRGLVGPCPRPPCGCGALVGLILLIFLGGAPLELHRPFCLGPFLLISSPIHNEDLRFRSLF